jgi:hypothetical protein
MHGEAEFSKSQRIPCSSKGIQEENLGKVRKIRLVIDLITDRQEYSSSGKEWNTAYKLMHMFLLWLTFYGTASR